MSFEAQGAKADLEEPPRGDDVGLFLHTSGTTSRPKGVPLTHANLAASLANIVATYELTPQDRSLLVMPLFHVHGLMAGAPLLQTFADPYSVPIVSRKRRISNISHCHGDVLSRFQSLCRRGNSSRGWQ